ncbi:PEPxxWA-CTERM sorting domain-containing protein [Phenylobacterium sp.]|uniref:PEPxxWA-CTERM sorting domain-containing protein n=1 Tax=Phenylobacterium sp. TaxID=1871053 RepID=UPI0035AEC4A4
MNKFFGAVCAGAALFLSAGAADAASVWQSTFQGATFTLTQNSATSVTFDIAGVNALTDNWAGAQYLGAFSFKGLGTTSVTATRSGVDTVGQAGGLNAGGCNGNGAGFVCFNLSPNVATAGNTNLTFNLTATSGAFDFVEAGPHLKILWSNNATKDNKVGDLYSQDIPGVQTGVPEPATWAMMITGFGLAGAAIRRRRGALAVA